MTRPRFLDIADRAEAHPIIGPILYSITVITAIGLLWVGLVAL